MLPGRRAGTGTPDMDRHQWFRAPFIHTGLLDPIIGAAASGVQLFITEASD